MLVLSRRVGEQIRMGDDICFKVLGVKGNQIRLGFDMPKDIPVHREEIYQRIQKEKRGLKYNRRRSSQYGNTRVYHSNEAWAIH